MKWIGPRTLKRADMEDLYAPVQYWLVDDAGRILAVLAAPAPDNENDSWDVHLKFGDRDSVGFVTLDQARHWGAQQAFLWIEKKKLTDDLDPLPANQPAAQKKASE